MALANEKLCPVCNGANLCSMANDKNAKDCWCKSLSLESAVKESITQRFTQQQCICEACIKAMNTEFIDAAKC